MFQAGSEDARTCLSSRLRDKVRVSHYSVMDVRERVREGEGGGGRDAHGIVGAPLDDDEKAHVAKYGKHEHHLGYEFPIDVVVFLEIQRVE